ncbi:MAG TPA: tetratricopeptide repeat protein [Acidobacteriaceae bacterium]
MKKIRFARRSISAAISATMSVAICATVGCMLATPAWAQTADATTAKIHGHAQDPILQPIANTKVELTTDGKTPLYTFTTDANGDYKGDGIKPGTYTIMLFGTITGKDGKPAQGTIDYQQNVKLPAAQDTQVDFDLSRQAYISKLPPDMQKKIAAVRKENSAAQQANSKIKNVNKLIVDARTARKAGNFDQAIALDTQATQAKPDVGLTWYELGDSDLAAKKYPDAVTNYKKSISVMGTEKAPKPAVLAAADNNLGEALAKSGDTTGAVTAYEAAATADPTSAGMYYSNEAVVLFKKNQLDQAAAAADKAIAADPTKAIAYYIKAQSMIQHASVDPKTNKIQLPPGCADAYRKFIELQPTGQLSDEARGILQQAGETVHSSYKKH